MRWYRCPVSPGFSMSKIGLSIWYTEYSSSTRKDWTDLKRDLTPLFYGCLREMLERHIALKTFDLTRRESMRVAAIDIGTNSIRLLKAEIIDGQLKKWQ